MLRQGDGSLRRYPRLGGGPVDDEDQRLARAFAEVNRSANGAQVMRAGPRWHDNQFRHGNDALDRHGDGRRRVDDGELEALLPKDFEVSREAGDGRLCKGGKFGLALVPPIGQ